MNATVRDTAYAAWDQAAQIIEDRAPRVHPFDDPQPRYTSPVPDDGSTIPGNLDTAFATAVLASLAHPGREHKRRALLAIRWLLATSPSATAPAMVMSRVVV